MDSIFKDEVTLTTMRVPEPPITLCEEEGKLLENYAGLAMQAIIGSIEPLKSQEDYDHISVAKDAFQFAQAMMQIRYLSKK